MWCQNFWNFFFSNLDFFSLKELVFFEVAADAIAKALIVSTDFVSEPNLL